MLSVVFVSVFSLLIDLRCLAHMELAKCDYDTERLEMALDNIDKVRGVDTICFLKYQFGSYTLFVVCCV